MVSAIVCVDNNWGIGSKNKLLINIPEDMLFFKNKTTNNVVVMGRKTYDSLPSKPLPYRTNIVITSKVDNRCEVDANGTIFASMYFVKTFLSTLSTESPIDYYVIGGGQVYKELLPYCDKAYVTKVNYAFKDTDTYFPDLDKNENWGITKIGKNKEYNGLEYRFCTYERRH